MQTQYTVTGARPEIKAKEGAPVALKLDNGTVVLRQFYTCGDYQDTATFPGDHPDAIHVDVYEERKKPKSSKKPAEEI